MGSVKLMHLNGNKGGLGYTYGKLFNSEEQSTKQIDLEGFENLGLLSTAKEKSLLELLGPLVLTPVYKSFFQSFVSFDHLV